MSKNKKGRAVIEDIWTSIPFTLWWNHGLGVALRLFWDWLFRVQFGCRVPIAQKSAVIAFLENYVVFSIYGPI